MWIHWAAGVGVGDGELELGTGEEELIILRAQSRVVRRSEGSNSSMSGSDKNLQAKRLVRGFRSTKSSRKMGSWISLVSLEIQWSMGG